MSPTAAESPSLRTACLGVPVVLAVLLLVASLTTILVAVAIWPGEAKLTAPLFCPDDKPDPFVVVDSYSVQPGETSYNFTLYCMGPRGEVTNVGFFWPCVVLTAGHAALIVLVVGVLLLWRRRRRASRAMGGPEGVQLPPGEATSGTSVTPT